MLKRRRTLYVYICIIVLMIYLLSRYILPLQIEITNRNLLEHHKCPACFGENLCDEVYHGKLKLVSWTRYTASKLLNARNVYYGVLSDNKNVIAKKLGHDAESDLLDGAICRLSEKSPYHCNPAHYIKFLTTLYTIENSNNKGDKSRKISSR